MSNPRVAGHLGKLPVKPTAERFAIGFLHGYLREPLPAPSYPVDVTGGIPDDAWGMCANGPDPTCTSHPAGLGDCGYAGRQHVRMSKAACYGETEQWETSDELVAEYLAYDHGQDMGVNLADVLLSWYQNGKIKAFAPVDHTDPNAIDSAMAAFRGVYCVAPSTRILTADLRWMEAGDISEGEALLGFDEDGPRRQWQRSVVTRAQRVMKPCYDLTFSDGTKVRCSADHQWLRTGNASYGNDRIRWVATEDMRVGRQRGTCILKPLEVWEAPTSYAAGYLAAAFDGEGHLRHRELINSKSGQRIEVELGFSQRENSMLTQVEMFLKEYGFPHSRKACSGTNGDVIQVGLYQRTEILRFLGSVRPKRLLDKFRPGVLGRLPLNRRIMLVDRVDVGVQEVVALTTTTGTFVAEGLASHNCGVDLTDDAQQLFAEGQPWSVSMYGELPDPELGHCIVKVTADGSGRDGYVTWAHRQEATREWTAACLTEAWVIVTTEDEAAKVDMAALLADIDALHGVGGNGSPAPAPAPAPVPVDHKSLLEEFASIVRQVAASADRDISEVVAWLASHGL